MPKKTDRCMSLKFMIACYPYMIQNIFYQSTELAYLRNFAIVTTFRLRVFYVYKIR